MIGKNPLKIQFLAKHKNIIICCLIVILTLSVYWQVTNYDFMNFDDTVYVTDNKYVQSGLNKSSVNWSFNFQDKTGTYWHPVTWLSHMLDCQIFGLNAKMHHLVNILFHIANSLLLFLILNRMTGASWRSAFVAALFALHPINVDTVAWIAERKNVLSTFFWMLSMAAYAFYTERPGIRRYLLIFFAMVIGIMAKQMLVTLPFVFLLLDYWPLRRVRFRRVMRNEPSILHLVFEKIPFLLLSIASIIVASLSLMQKKQLLSIDVVPIDLRIANAIVSYVKYIWKMLWPMDLAIFYPYPTVMFPSWVIIGALLLLASISAFVIYQWVQRPYLMLGWLWFIGTLFPVSGLMQGGLWPAMADRWAYVPFIGLYIMIGWGIPDLLNTWRYKKLILFSGIPLLLILLAGITWTQTKFWENNFTLFQHAINVTKDNYIAHYNIGKHHQDHGNIEKAMRHYTETLRIRPDYTDAHINLGVLLKEKGLLSEAKKHYQRALELKPLDVDAHNNLGIVLYAEGHTDEAIMHYGEALRINSSDVKTLNNLGIALFEKGEYGRAFEQFQKAIRIEPDNTATRENLEKSLLIKENIAQSSAINKAVGELKKNPENVTLHIKLGDLYRNAGVIGKAREHYKKALSIRPGLLNELQNQAVTAVAKGEYKKALFSLRRMIDLKPETPDVYYNIACVYARMNREDESIAALKIAIERGFNDWDLLKTDKDLENIRNTPYYRKLIKGS